MSTKPNILLIDYRRSFLDGRDCLHAYNSKSAVEMLVKHEKSIDVVWLDYELGPGDNAKVVLDFLLLRAKLGMHYPVKVINVHSPAEAGWQIVSSKLRNSKYVVRRETIRETLGSY